MKTRTLLLLAVTCGLAILVAGTVQLLRVSGQERSSGTLEVGQGGRAGDAQVTLLAVQRAGTTVTITMRIGGVDDPAGLSGFSLVAPGKVVAPAPGTGTCAAFTTAPQTCDLVFQPGKLDSPASLLLFRRADSQLRWDLTP